MNFLRHVFRAALAVAACGLAAGAEMEQREHNAWPVVVQHFDAQSHVDSWTGAGPFLFSRPDGNGGTFSGLRPLWLQQHNAQGEFRAGYFLYPLFSYTVDENTYKWSLFELIRRTDRRPSAGAPQSVFDQRGLFEVWPFWFARDTGDPEMSYRGLFPIYGTVRNKLGFERLSWTLFPLYVENEKKGAITTSTPWPFIRVTRGAAHGWAVWPLYSLFDRPGVERNEFFLWPLGYNHVKQPAADAPAGTAPRHDYGFLPFYAKSTGPGYMDENFLWPFFGRTERDLPNRYSEVRYFWPFLVQGRGDDHYVNRWGPFYTNSVVKGYDKTWIAWPLWRHATWTDAERDLVHEKNQLLYFLYWSERQTSATRAHAPAAEMKHVWPLFSAWDNGAGRKQFQALSPFEVFFPGNEKVRNNWTPLVALVRHEQRAPDDTRTALLWNLVTWERAPVPAPSGGGPEERREFHVGPLFSTVSVGDEKRVAIGNGLFGFKREGAGAGWRMFWLDFGRKPATTSAR